MTTSGASALAHYVSRWSLEPDGLPFATRHSWLLAVRQADKPCLLKLRKPESDEYLTAALLSYFGGDGAVRLIAGDGPAVLMERACGVVSLMDMAAAGGDDAAAAVLAETIGKLHTERNMPPPQGLTPLEEWFKPLFQQAPKLPQLAAIVPVARALLAAPFAPAVLHGDLHHDNVVFDQRRGWLAIDPKGLWGERTYEVANLLRNPWPNAALVHDADRMGRMAAFYAGRLGAAPRTAVRGGPCRSVRKLATGGRRRSLVQLAGSGDRLGAGVSGTARLIKGLGRRAGLARSPRAACAGYSRRCRSKSAASGR